MNREENILFPAILDAQTEATTAAPAFGSIGNPIAMVEQEHDWEAERLEKIRKLAQLRASGMRPKSCACCFMNWKHWKPRCTRTRLESSILFASALS
jgi:iron-sulfur cluster repair protein YtfE (RIC family)